MSLQEMVQELRGRVERQTGAQRETIGSLEDRLAAFEKALRSPLLGYPPSATRIGTFARMLAMLVVFVAIVAAPLFVVHRSTCPVRGQVERQWSLFIPGWGEPPKGCSSETGATVLLREAGID